MRQGTKSAKSAGCERTATPLRDVWARPPVVSARSNSVPLPRRMLPGMTLSVALAQLGPVRSTVASACSAGTTSSCPESDGTLLLISAATGREGGDW